MKAIKPTIAYVIMLIVVVFDQASKVLTRLYTAEGDTFVIGEKLFGETFRFTHLTNTGAAFSIGLSNPLYNRIIFSLIALVAIGFIIFLLKRVTHRIQVYAFGLVLGGALGNMIDRVLLGGVTDFIDVDFPDF
ncbi:MAG: signal peptidase II, partial [Candidatus Cloacimonadaceae bacterium]|nr:signal peptidase II [Candidatus Cloacimonadaceae bacterium]